MADAIQFLFEIGAVDGDTMQYGTIATEFRSGGIGGVEGEGRLAGRYSHYTIGIHRPVRGVDAIDEPVEERQHLVIAHAAFGGVHRHGIDRVYVQFEVSCRVASVDGMELQGVDEVSGMVGRYRAHAVVIRIEDRVGCNEGRVLVFPSETAELAGVIDRRSVRIDRMNGQAKLPYTIALERVGMLPIGQNDSFGLFERIGRHIRVTVPREFLYRILTNLHLYFEQVTRRTVQSQIEDRVVTEGSEETMFVDAVFFRSRQVGDGLP